MLNQPVPASVVHMQNMSESPGTHVKLEYTL
jgi:hypothetical protein